MSHVCWSKRKIKNWPFAKPFSNRSVATVASWSKVCQALHLCPDRVHEPLVTVIPAHSLEGGVTLCLSKAKNTSKGIMC